MTIQRCELRMSDGDGGMFQADDGRWVTYDDHEATVRLRMAEAERNGRQACRMELEWRCRAWGMTTEEIGRCETFSKLLDAYTEHVHQTGRSPIGNSENHRQHDLPNNYAE